MYSLEAFTSKMTSTRYQELESEYQTGCELYHESPTEIINIHGETHLTLISCHQVESYSDNESHERSHGAGDNSIVGTLESYINFHEVGDESRTKSHKSYTDGSIKAFCLQFINLAQFKLIRTLLVGSTEEIRGQTASVLAKLSQFNLKLDMFDVDMMNYSIFCYAFPHRQPIPETYNGNIVTSICTDGHHAGYATLMKSNNIKLNITDLTYGDTRHLHGPAMLQDVKALNMQHKITYLGCDEAANVVDPIITMNQVP